jgi:hypothetical protein
MEAVFYILGLFFLKHFLFDFVLQPRKMAVTKGDSWPMLLLHTSIQGVSTMLLLFIVSACILPISINLILTLALVDFLLHTIVDKMSTQLYKRKKLHPMTHSGFWIVLGADQMLHQLTYILITIFIVT